MLIAAVQINPQFGEIEININRAVKLIEGHKAEIYVLPELCFSGYTFTSREEAFNLADDPKDCFSMKQMLALSNKLDAGIVFGFPEKSGDKIYNSCAFVKPDGKTHIYRKLHLFYYEKEWFAPGDKPLDVFEFRGCKIGMMICFDWIFPEVMRSLSLMGANLIIHPSNLVMQYCQQAMVTRSLENMVYSITVNRIGREKRGDFDLGFTGKSQILDIRGERLFQASSDKEEIGIADININSSSDKWINEKNDLFSDRRSEYYRMNNEI